MNTRKRAGIALAVLGLFGVFLAGSGSPADAAPGTHRVSGTYILNDSEGGIGGAGLNVTCTIICVGRINVGFSGHNYSDHFTGSFVGVLDSISTDPGSEQFAMHGLALGSQDCFTYGSGSEPCHVPNPALMIGSAQLACTPQGEEATGQGIAFAFPPQAVFGNGSVYACDTSDLTIT